MNRYRLVYTLLLTALMASVNAQAGVVVKKSVYGGGNLASVGGNTTVNVGGGEIGTEGEGGAEFGNVYGGGKGDVTGDDDKDVELGLVKGNTFVNIWQLDGKTTKIWHNVYGGGAFGSVGTFDLSTDENKASYGVPYAGMPVNWTSNTGKATINITGGTIGTNGKDNGMIFGSSRGDVAGPNSIHDKLAWVNDTEVTINGGQINGSVYGSGENGHTFHDAKVIVHSGTIGIASGSTITTNDNGTPEDTSDDTTYSGAAYPYRGNVYGGGCGTDKYDNNTKFNPLAGIVYGTTTVNIDGGQVVHNVYGAGAMGSVGKMTTTTSDNTSTTTFTSGGTTTIEISGGTVGVSGTVGDGNVFGAARGDAATAQTDVALVKATGVTISGTTTGTNIWGSVYGGGETGDVGTYTTDADGYNIYPDDTGVCTVSISGGTIHHNVFGAGKGIANTFECPKAMVNTASVTISNGVVNGNVYGGGEIGRVENNIVVTVGLEKVADGTSTYCTSNDGTDEGSVLAEGTPVVGKYLRSGDAEPYTYTLIEASAPEVKGSVFGAGAGKATHGYSALVRGNPSVTIQGNAKVRKNVYGGGEIATAGRYKVVDDLPTERLRGGDCTVIIQGKAEIGPESTSATDDEGNVFGACKGVVPQYSADFKKMNHNNGWDSFATVDKYLEFLGTLALATETEVTIRDNVKIKGSVFGGGERGIVKQDVTVDILGGTISKDVYGGGSLADTQTNNWNTANNIWADDKIKADGSTRYKTTVNLTGGKLRDAYGGGLGIHDVGEEGNEGYVAGTPAYVYGDVTVELNKDITSTKGCIVERIFGSNNLKGSPKGHVKVHVYATQHKDKENVAAKYNKYENITNYTNTQYDTYLKELATTYEVPLPSDYETTIARTEYASLPGENDAEKQKYLQKLKDQAFEEFRDEISKKKYDVLAVYGGGNLAPYEPAGGTETTESAEVIIDGCELTSIKQVYGGGNAAPAPATNVTVNGTHEIDEVFGGGNGKDNYVLDGKYYVNPGANVGYYNYTHLNGAGSGTLVDPFDCEDNANATTKEGRAVYIYGTGVANTEIYGGRIHYVYGASNEKGNISGSARSRYEEDEALNCSMIVDQTYGGGKNSIIDGTIDLDLGCTQNMAEIFGGSKNADVNSDIVLNITNGTYGKVFGGNNTSGNVNGSITVNIKEEGCSPVIIKELYLGGYLAPYSIYGYKANGDPRTKEEFADLIKDKTEEEIADAGLSSLPRQNPRINVISASRIDNIYGGGYQAPVVGNPHVNINMEEGVMQAKYVKTGFLDEHKDADGNLLWQGKEIVKDDDNKVVKGILKIGTIGNIYGGGNMADIVGNTYVEIGNGFWLKEGTDDVWETKNAAGATYTYEKKTGSDVWKWYDKDGVEATTTPTPARYTAKVTGNVFGGGDNAAVQGNTYVNVCAVNNDDPATTDDIEMISVTLPTTVGNDVKIDGNIYGGGNMGAVGTFTSATNPTTGSKEYTWTAGGVCNVTINGGTIGPETPTQGSPGNVFGAGKGLAETFECEPAMVDGTIVCISNGTVNGTVYGGGEVGRVNHDTEVMIGLESGTKPVIKGDVFGAGKGTNTHGYSALVRGKATVIVQGDAKVEESVYGGGEIASVGSYKIKKGDKKPADAPDWVLIGMPYSLRDEESESGKCIVIVRGNAEIGPDGMKMNTTTGKPDDTGHVFGAGKGVLPYHDIDDNIISGDPWRMKPGDDEHPTGIVETFNETTFSQAYYTNLYGANYDKKLHNYEVEYLQFIETLALATETDVTISGNAFVKGSVYGGSMNGHVQHDTRVTIAGGQIGQGKGRDERYSDDDWKSESLAACDCWGYVANGAPYDPLATTQGSYDYTNYPFIQDTDRLSSSEGGKPIATDGHTYYGNVFGGGSGVIPYAPGKWHRASGSVGGNTVVNITGGHILSNVYGGNEQTDVGTYAKDDPTTPATGGKCTITMSGGTVGVPRDAAAITALPTIGHLYGAGKGDKRIFFNTWTNVATTEVNINGGIIYGNVYGGGEDGHVMGLAKTTISETDASNKPTIIGCDGTSGFDGDVYGGGQGSVTALTAGVVGGNVNLNIDGGTMKGSVYGGGRLASVGTHFATVKMEDPDHPGSEIDNPNYGKMQDGDGHGCLTINLKGGTIEKNVYGGCMGTTDNIALGVSKNIVVNLNNYPEDEINTAKGCVVKGSIFGCNNVNSSPEGTVVVHVYGTQHEGKSQIANTDGDNPVTDAKTKDNYDVTAVYGGGNMAAYIPKDLTTGTTNVIIDGCGLTSIQTVYGGGNAASTPATSVTINGTFEIKEVFGGGNGKDKITFNNVEKDNPGANVGFYDYSAVESTYDTKEKRQETEFTNKYVYGTGKASVNIFGGTIHRVFGGSNTKGNVRQTAVTMLEEVGGCDFCVDEAYGGGKSAPMDAEAKLLMACIPGLSAAYGGAEAADIQGNVTLTITNGRFERVFGGNNLSGTIRGAITVNVEEVGCKPIIIGELYGGGNQAGYSVYGYKQMLEKGKLVWKPRESATDNTADGVVDVLTNPYSDPQVNVKSFTSIGAVYGGGYGKTAMMVGNPTVNVSVVEGAWKDYVGESSRYSETGYEYNATGYKGDIFTISDGTTTHDVELPSHDKGKIGAIGKVFGGGNAAPVKGNTNVNIGTLTNVSVKGYVEKSVSVGASVEGFYTRSGEGTAASPYRYIAATGTAVAGTTYYEEKNVEKDVIGVDIRGNVYGGGNEAEVTGNTNVVIGREETTTTNSGSSTTNP